MTSKHLIINSALKNPIDRIPVWLMRQAGRYQAEFRAIRAKVDFLTLCNTPELAVEVSLLPIQQSGMDGAIIFSDLLIPAQTMGSDLEYVKGVGPVIHNPVRNEQDFSKLKSPIPQEASPALGEAISLLKKELAGKIPVLGFTGAPWTLAAYMIEGGGSRSYVHVKKMMYQAPELFHKIMEHLCGVLVDYLCYQAESGAELLQVFDTWAGAMTAADYRKFALPYTQKVILETKKRCSAPIVHYNNINAHLLEDMAESGADVLSVDWRISLSEAKARVGDKVALQGNFDPVKLFATQEEIELEVKRILEDADSSTGLIFNLGHGIVPETPVENVQFLVESVKKYGRNQ